MSLALFAAACGDDDTTEHMPAPSAPTLVAGDGIIVASWDAVEEADAYVVWVGTGADPGEATQASTELTETSTTLTGLTNGTLYYVWITALGTAGTSTFSHPAVAIPVAPLEPPGAPGAPALSIGNGSLAATWNAVDGASAYEVWFGTVEDTAQAAQSGGAIPETHHVITGLTNGTPYYVWLRAINGAGAGPFSPAAAATPNVLPSAPGAPTLGVGDRQLDVSWDAVTGAVSYQVQYASGDPAGSPQVAGTGITGTSHVITGLTNGTAYLVWILAENAVGTSASGPPSMGTPNAVPTAPTAPTLGIGDGRLDVDWVAVSGASAYEVWYGTTNDTSTATQAGGDVADTHSVLSGLANGTPAYVWVRAKNNAGVGPFSAPGLETPNVPPLAPAAPTLGIGDGQLDVDWVAVSGADSYDVWYCRVDAAATPVLAASAHPSTSTTIYGLTNGVAYFVWLQARNNAGPGASGLPALEMPNAIPVAPGAPVVTEGNQQLELQWSTVAGASSYIVWRSTTDATATATVEESGLTDTHYTITGLPNDERLFVWIQAVNNAGASGYSPTADGTPVCQVYVDVNNPSYGDGTPEHPFREIQDGILMAQTCTPAHVLIAAGTYPLSAGLEMRNNVSLHGGYRSGDWSDRSYATAAERADGAYQTIVAYHGSEAKGVTIEVVATVYCGSGIGRATVIEGLTVQASSADDIANARDYTAIYTENCSLTARNNTLEAGQNPNNVARNGAFNAFGSAAAPRLLDNTLVGGAGLSEYTLWLDRSSGTTPTEVIDNHIVMGTANFTYGLFAYANTVLIQGNTIDGGTASNAISVAIRLYPRFASYNESTEIIDNVLAPSAGVNRYGIYEETALSDPLTVENNTFSNCTVYYRDEGTTNITDGNTVINNGAAGGSGTLLDWGNILN